MQFLVIFWLNQQISLASPLEEDKILKVSVGTSERLMVVVYAQSSLFSYAISLMVH